MDLADRLEKRAKELDQKVSVNMSNRPYEYQSAADRELIEQAAKRLRELEPKNDR